MDYKPFDQSLPDGHGGERRVIDALVASGAQVQHLDCRSAFDFTATIHFGHPERFEVKREDNYADSGNLCLEVLQGRREPKASGISVSESTVCVHTLGEKLAVYRTQPMRLFLKANEGRWPLRPFGDNGNRGYVVPITDLLAHPWFNMTDDAGLAKSQVFLSGSETAVAQ